MTAAIGLFRRLGIPPPPEDTIITPTGVSADAIVINGASSSVGSFAVELAKRAGLYVVGIAGNGSPYAKDMGADVVVDYRKYNNGQIPADSRLATSTNDWVKASKAKFAEPETVAKIEKVKQLTVIADELGVTTSQLALAWTAKNPHVRELFSFLVVVLVRGD